jgi:RHS repeat-associated protein
VRDAQGNLLALYTKDASSLKWDEQHLYGSSRVGMARPGLAITTARPNDAYSATADPIANGIEGKRSYELTNHLGNVLATISDRKLAVPLTGNPSQIDYYTAELLSSQDYYTFGMLMPGRNSSSTTYRYGFGGKEKSNEIYGEGNAYDFGDRIQDPRLGRFLSVDPLQKKYPNWTPYAYAMNSPLKLKDIDGKDVGVTIVGNTITFNSTVFVTGPGASDIAQKANTSFNSLSKAALSNRTYTSAEGKCYEVQFQVHYVSVDPSNPKDPNYAAYQQTLNAKTGTNGNNIVSAEAKGSRNLILSGGEGTRSNAGYGSNDNYAKNVIEFKNSLGFDQVRSEFIQNTTGNKAYVYNQALGATAVHETFHLFGLGDRYIEAMTLYYTWIRNGKTITETIPNARWYQAGFANDLMSNNSMTNFSQTHIDNLASKALELSKGKEGRFVIGQNVDNSTNTNGTPDPTPSGGYSITPPKKDR